MNTLTHVLVAGAGGLLGCVVACGSVLPGSATSSSGSTGTTATSGGSGGTSSGSTTGSTNASTTGSTSGPTAGSTTGSTSASTTGSTSASTTGSTTGVGGASATSTAVSTSAASTSAGAGGAPPVGALHFIGRFDTSDPVGPSFAWPGSAITAHFAGTGVDLVVNDPGGTFFEVVIDNGKPAVVITTSAKTTYNLASNLPAGEHTVWIEKRDETYFGTVQFVAFKATGGLPLVASPEPFTRSIELIGDSITCGYGADGVGPFCKASEDVEDEYFAYGALTARALNAAHVDIAYSGIGVYRDYAGSTTDQMPVRYERTLGDDPLSTWGFATKPDVVVINLGSNDFSQGDPGQPYIDAYTNFVKQVRGHYPKAFILLAVGSMLTDMQLMQALAYTHSIVDAANKKGDTKVSFVDLGQQDGAANGLGCDSHPSLKTHTIMAANLQAAIQKVTGW